MDASVEHDDTPEQDEQAVAEADGDDDALTLEQGIKILKAVKVMAAADGLSGIERAGIRRRMVELGIPRAVQEEIESFDAESVELDEILKDFRRGGRQARYLIIAAISVASVDGYSDQEKGLVRSAAGRVGISEQFVTVLEAAEKVARMVELLQDPELAEAWQDLGASLLDLDEVVLAR